MRTDGAGGAGGRREHAVRQDVLCVCGEFYWSYVFATTDVAALQKRCPKCREHVLLVVREDSVLGVVPFEGGWSASALTRSLARVDGLTDAEIETLVVHATATAASGA